MKHTFYLLLVLTICCVGCKTTLLTLDSPNIPLKSEMFTYEDDIVKITYGFWSLGGAVRFTIFNKLEVPLYVDWKNSAHIYNGRPNYYWKDEAVAISKGRGSYSYYGSSQRTITHEVREDRITAIPPKSDVERAEYLLLLNEGGFPVGVFTAENSPVRFREYFYLYTSEDLKTGQHLVDNSFFVAKSEIVKDSKVAQNIAQYRFYFVPKKTR